MARHVVVSVMVLSSLLGLAKSALAADEGGQPTEVEETVEIAAAPEPEPALNPAVEKRLDCIAYYESKNYAGATNPSSKAAGLFQFLWSTWASTPQGRSGLSPYDPVAARNAARWMLAQGRAREWIPVQRGLC
jgi:hypothetical protein